MQHINGEMPTKDRIKMLDKFASIPDEVIAITTNCCCLGLGVNVPEIDGIIFLDPRSSEVDIIQAIGRLTRISPDKDIGTIVVPVVLHNDVDVAIQLDNSNFKAVWKVVRALQSQDEQLALTMKNLRASSKADGGTEAQPVLPAIFHFDLPDKYIGILDQALATEIVFRTTSVREKVEVTKELLDQWIKDHVVANDKTPHALSEEIPNSGGLTWGAINQHFGKRNFDFREANSLAKYCAEM
jgi:predicted helicase